MRSVLKAFQYGFGLSAACVVLLFFATEAFADHSPSAPKKIETPTA